MAIDSVNWRRELEGVRAEIHALKDEIAKIHAELFNMNELLRLIAANQIMTSLDNQIQLEENIAEPQSK